MNLLRQTHRVYAALCFNGIVLVLILLTLISRDGKTSASGSAFAQVPPVLNGQPLAGRGLNVMPAQLSPQVWGCYVLDEENQTLDVYSYQPGEHMLRLESARDIRYDRQLKARNTSPTPADIRAEVERSQEPSREAPPATVTPESAKP